VANAKKPGVSFDEAATIFDALPQKVFTTPIIRRMKTVSFSWE